MQVPTEGVERLNPFVFIEAAERWVESQVEGVDGAEVVVLSDDDPPGAVCAWAAEAGSTCWCWPPTATRSSGRSWGASPRT